MLFNNGVFKLYHQCQGSVTAIAFGPISKHQIYIQAHVEHIDSAQRFNGIRTVLHTPSREKKNIIRLGQLNPLTNSSI